MDPMITTVVIIAVAVILFFTELIPITATAMLTMLALFFTKVLTASEALAGFSDSTNLMFLFMLILGGALEATGLAKVLGNAVAKIVKTEGQFLAAFCVISVALSTFLSNIGTMVVLAPIMMGICKANGYSPAKIMMPIAFACSMGGMNSVAGATPPAIALSTIEEAGLGTFGFFEFAKVGLPICIISLTIMCTLLRPLFPKDNVEIDASKLKEKEATEFETPRNMKICAAIFVCVVIVMVFTKQLGIALWAAAATGCVVLYATKVITPKESWKFVGWDTYFLMATLTSLGSAVSKSGLAEVIANYSQEMLGEGAPEWKYVLVVYLASGIVTQFMNNTAAARLFAPIILAIGVGIGLDPRIGLMTMNVSAAAAFATPIGTPCNFVAMEYAGYKFKDFIKLGLPIFILCAVLCMIIIPIMY